MPFAKQKTVSNETESSLASPSKGMPIAHFDRNENTGRYADPNGKDTIVEECATIPKKWETLSRMSLSFSSPHRKSTLTAASRNKPATLQPETPPIVARAIEGLFPSSRGSKAMREEESSSTPTRSPVDTQTESNKIRKTKDDEAKGIFSWTDVQLSENYDFDKEIGFGNWGSCWIAEARSQRDGTPKGTMVAVKVVHRQGTTSSNARVKALWNEYKILLSCGKPIHRNLVEFREFIVTPSYALVVMKHYQQTMNVALPASTYAGPTGYFHQLLSAIHWLHSKSVTHCDIKVANLLVDTSKEREKGVPILVDFGFATLHSSKTNFLSKQSWGTPEYLSPERSRGDWHDERLSDMWALGVTFFEIATGRTPFEHEDEQFLSKEQLEVYYQRTLSSEWIGTWSIPQPLESLCRLMLTPQPERRMSSGDALLHAFFITRSEGMGMERSPDSKSSDYRPGTSTEQIPGSSNLSRLGPLIADAKRLGQKRSATDENELSAAILVKSFEEEHEVPLRESDQGHEELQSKLTLNKSRLSIEYSKKLRKGTSFTQLERHASRSSQEESHLKHNEAAELGPEEVEGGVSGDGHLANWTQAKDGHISNGREAMKAKAEVSPGPISYCSSTNDQMFEALISRNNRRITSPLEMEVSKGQQERRQERGRIGLGEHEESRWDSIGTGILPAERTSRQVGPTDEEMETLATQAHDMTIALERPFDTRSIVTGSSKSTSTVQMETVELVARLDEMGALATKLSRMVSDTKFKLSSLQDSSAVPPSSSIASVTSSAQHSFGGPLKLKICPEHSSKTNETSLEGRRCQASSTRPSIMAGRTSTTTPPSTTKTRSNYLQPSAVLSFSLENGAHREETSSAVGLSSTVVNSSETIQSGVRASAKASLEGCGRDETFPTSPDGAQRRKYSTSGRGLGHFLTRYGSRRIRTVSARQLSSEAGKEDCKTSPTLYDKATIVHLDSLSKRQSGIQIASGGQGCTAKSKGSVINFFEDEAFVHVGASHEKQNPQMYLGDGLLPSPKKSSRVWHNSFSSVKRSPQSRAASLAFGRLDGAENIATCSPPSSHECASLGARGALSARLPGAVGRKEKDRTLVRMKSFTLGRNPSTKENGNMLDENHSLRKVHRRRESGISPGSKGHADVDFFPTQRTAAPLTPLVGEDPLRHQHKGKASNDPSFAASTGPGTPVIPVQGGKGIWNRIFRSNTESPGRGRY